MKAAIAILALACVAGIAPAADITSTRETAYDWQAQKADGTAISNHTRFDTAFVACLNNPACVYVAGGRYKITRATAPPPPPVTGSVALSWTVPTQNTDGTPLTDLAGYRLYHGTSPTSLTDVRQVTGTSYNFTGLASGTHYFAVAAVNTAGVESSLSAVGNKAIP